MWKKIEGNFSRGMLDKKIKVYRETKKLESKAKVKTIFSSFVNSSGSSSDMLKVGPLL